MKKHLTSIFLVSLGIILCSSILAQQTATNWSDVIAEEKGDTVVVKGYSSGFFNTLLTAVKGDTTETGERVNPNRIYETIPGDTYISDVTLELDATVPLLHITAALPEEGVLPPLHLRAVKADGTFDKTFFQSPGNTYMENQYFLHGTINDTWEEREFMRCMGVATHHEYHNVIFEMTNWTHHVPFTSGQTYKYVDCKFLNVGNEATLEKGCVLETRTLPPDTVWMENCTLLNGGILVLGLEITGPMFVYMNHNTIVNLTQPPLCFSTGAEMVVTNNLFINTGLVADYPGFYPLFDDDDFLPKGIINMDTMEQVWINNWYLDSAGNSIYPFEDEADRKVMFENNNIWWDSRFETMVTTTLPAEQPIDTGGFEWMSQMILMNDRTKAMFDDDDAYPYLNEGSQYNIEPDFANNKDIVDEWVSYIVTNSTPGAPNGGDMQPKWRTNLTSNIFTIDWPMLANLNYTDATLVRGGFNEFPLGDLNWFSESTMNDWKASGEAAKLIEGLKEGKIPPSWTKASIKDNEMAAYPMSVYPNPFSSTANIQFDLVTSANVGINIYNLIGENVMSLDLGYKGVGKHNVTIDKAYLNSGMYILEIDAERNGTVTTKISIK